MSTMRFRYSSPNDIGFRGEIDTGIDVDEWRETDNRDQQEILWDLVANHLIWLEEIE